LLAILATYSGNAIWWN
jgi:hypothetical protein